MSLPKISYSGKDFTFFKNELINYIKSEFPNSWQDFYTADFGMILLNSIAYLADILSYYQDVNANEAFQPKERKTLKAIASLLGYHVRTATPASVTLNATVLGNVKDVLMQKGTKIVVGNLTYELPEDYLLAAGVETRTITAVEGSTYTKIFNAPQPVSPSTIYYAANHDKCISGSVHVFIGADEQNLLEWQYVDSLFLANPGDLVYSVSFDVNDRAIITFGDSVYHGMKPDVNSMVKIEYRVGGGTIGNRSPGSINTTIIGDTDVGIIEVKIDNLNDQYFASGGEEQESVESALANMPLFIRTADKVITEEDYNTIINNFSDSNYGSVAIGKAFLRRSVDYNRGGNGSDQFRSEYLRAPILPVNAIDVFIWARSTDINGNPILVTPSEGLKSALKNYLTERSVVCTDIYIWDGEFKSIDVTVEYGLKSALSFQAAYDDLNSRVTSFFNWSDINRQFEIAPGETIYPSNLTRWLEQSPYIRYVTVSSPAVPIVLNPNQMPIKGLVSLTRV